LRIFIILDRGELRRPNSKTPIIAGDFEPAERLDPFLLNDIKDRFLTEEVEGITDGNMALIGVENGKIFGMILDFLFRNLEPVIAGDAGDQQFPIVPLRNRQISGREGHRQGFVRTMGGTRTAAGPVIELMESDIKEG